MLEQALLEEREALEEEQVLLKAQAFEIETRLHEIEHRLDLVNGLMGTPSISAAPHSGRNGTAPKPRAVDMAFEVLSDCAPEPMYYKDLAQEVRVRGGDLSGENAAQILVARLVNDERFVRPIRKGFYALRKDYPTAKNVGQRRARGKSRNSR
jgi:hypothetical protein